jgi:hypothetical protein
MAGASPLAGLRHRGHIHKSKLDFLKPAEEPIRMPTWHCETCRPIWSRKLLGHRSMTSGPHQVHIQSTAGASARAPGGCYRKLRKQIALVSLEGPSHPTWMAPAEMPSVGTVSHNLCGTSRDALMGAPCIPTWKRPAGGSLTGRCETGVYPIHSSRALE